MLASGHVESDKSLLSEMRSHNLVSACIAVAGNTGRRPSIPLASISPVFISALSVFVSKVAVVPLDRKVVENGAGDDHLARLRRFESHSVLENAPALLPSAKLGLNRDTSVDMRRIESNARCSVRLQRRKKLVKQNVARQTNISERRHAPRFQGKAGIAEYGVIRADRLARMRILEGAPDFPRLENEGIVCRTRPAAIHVGESAPIVDYAQCVQRRIAFTASKTTAFRSRRRGIQANKCPIN